MRKLKVQDLNNAISVCDFGAAVVVRVIDQDGSELTAEIVDIQESKLDQVVTITAKEV